MSAQPVTDSADEEQRRMLRESAQAFAAKELKPGRFRALRSQPVQFDRALWKSMAEMGWAGLTLPEQYGGSALGFGDAAAIVEELGRPLLPEPLVAAAVFGGGLINHGDNAALKERLLPLLCAGDLIPAVAHQEGLKTFAPVACRAEASGGGYVLNGEKAFVRPAVGCDGFIVSAKASDGLGLFWVPAANGALSAGAALTTERATDGSDVGRLKLANVKVAAADVVASPRSGNAAFERALDETLLLVSAELLGLSRGALDITLAYLRTRVQFGKAIGSFQALQHRAVDLFLQQELAAAALTDISEHFEAAGEAERHALASRLKARCGGAAMLITREAIQMHGAIGFTDEYDIGFYLKRALALSAWLGNSAEHRLRYAQNAGSVAK